MSPNHGAGALAVEVEVDDVELLARPIQFFAGAGDRLKLAIDEVAGGTPTVDGIVQVDPIA